MELVLQSIVKSLYFFIPLILLTAYLSLAERKIIAWMQLRVGPNVAGPHGLLQPIADAIKLIFKEPLIPQKADKLLFVIAPAITFSLAMLAWAVVPVNSTIVIADINVGLLYLMAISSLSVYGIIIAGWSSNSNYAFLGGIRSAAQMISYEIAIGLCILCVLISTGSLNLKELVLAQEHMPFYLKIIMIPVGVIFFISGLAETNRHPFDLPEAEAELVAGYHVEYSSLLFSLFFLGEYANMILMSAMTTMLFLGGWLPPFNIAFLKCIPEIVWFVIKICLCLFLFIWIRASIPRYRYDQLMEIGWKVFLPITFLLTLITCFVVFLAT